MLKLFALAALSATPAAAAVIDLSPSAVTYSVASYDAAGNHIANNVVVSGNTITNDGAAFWTATVGLTVVRPGLGTATLTGFTADDRSVFEIGGTGETAAVGIFGAGTGRMFFYPTGNATDWPFAANGTDFKLGLDYGDNEHYELAEFFVNNTNAGISGDARTGGPSSLTFDLTLDIGGVPEPSSWSLLIVGVGALGLALRHRRARVLA